MVITHNRCPGLGDVPAGTARHDYAVRHLAAAREPRSDHERGLVALAAGIQCYVTVMIHHAEDGEVWDGVMSAAIGDLLAGFRQLLAGERGRLDGGLCDEWVVKVAAVVNWDLDREEMVSRDFSEDGEFLVDPTDPMERARMVERGELPSAEGPVIKLTGPNSVHHPGD